jgi:DNA-binding transcriptional MerR regulator
MPTIENQSLSKLYYSIGEVAEHLQVNASLLRFWEKEFNLAVSKKNKKGNRLYTVKEIEKIQRIYQLVKVEGYTLDGAKKALKVKVEPHLSVQNEVVAASLEANTGFVQNASSLDAAALITKLEAIKKRLLSLNLEDLSGASTASTASTNLTTSIEQTSKPKSVAKPKPSTDAPTLFDF